MIYNTVFICNHIPASTGLWQRKHTLIIQSHDWICVNIVLLGLLSQLRSSSRFVRDLIELPNGQSSHFHTLRPEFKGLTIERVIRKSHRWPSIGRFRLLLFLVYEQDACLSKQCTIGVHEASDGADRKYDDAVNRHGRWGVIIGQNN